MEQLTTYRAKGKEIGLVFLFKYDLNGNLKLFEIAEGELNAKQMKWLFALGNFPGCESIMRAVWMKEKAYKEKFEVEVSPADLSFDAFWKLYDYKVSKEQSHKAWNKLKEAEKIKCFNSLKNYNKHLEKTKVAKAHLVTWLNQKRFNDEY